MKKVLAMVLVVVMMLALGVTAFAAKGPLTVEEAKQVALDYAGVKAADAGMLAGISAKTNRIAVKTAVIFIFRI